MAPEIVAWGGLAACVAIGLMLLAHVNPIAAAPKGTPTVDNLAALQTAAREACEAQGHTLRALLIAYDEKAQPVAARAACGEPRRSKS